MKSKLSLAICAVIWTLMLITNCNMETFCKMTNAVCETMNTSWVLIHECRLRAISRNITTLNIDITFLHPAHVIDLRLELKTKAFGYKPSIFNYTIDACTFLRQRKHRVFMMFWRIFKDFSNINHTCPYVGKQIVKDFYYDPANLTLPIPSGDYVVLFTWILDKKPQFFTNIYFSFYQDIINV
ncbi:uncharacterized protein LOC133843050 [Drosophila sulfurigaster albostrigata]|uniref:uncharacterized protein LOC133843050 n=1 Tax=Drosophila sulfurigaster albostrigata TaxID=89887 RepID=UPI002D21BE18|nr:uncharacterized protein LOC133843050 [Drosophila sulfurigaster albostrigata]